MFGKKNVKEVFRLLLYAGFIQFQFEFIYIVANHNNSYLNALYIASTRTDNHREKIQQSKWEGKIPFNRKSPDRTLVRCSYLQVESDAWLVVTVD